MASGLSKLFAKGHKRGLAFQGPLFPSFSGLQISRQIAREALGSAFPQEIDDLNDR